MRTASRVGLFGSLTLAASACSSSDSEPFPAPSVTLSESELQFGDVSVGSSKTLSFTVSNGGSRTVEVLAEAGTGFSNDFRFSPEQLSLMAGGAAEVTVGFAPTSAGEQSSTLVLRVDSGVESSVVLSGTGLDDGLAVDISPTVLDFGGVVVESERRLDLDLTNPSTGPVRVRVDLANNIGLCGEASGDVTDFCLDDRDLLDINQRITLEGLQSVTLQVVFNPIVAGDTGGQLVLRPCDNCSAVQISLDGVGVESGLACDEALSFGRVFPGECRTLDLTCRNVGNLTQTVNSIGERPGRPLPIEFRPAPLPEPVVLQAGDEVGFPIEFCPEDVSETTAVVRIDSTDGEGRDSFTLTDLTGEGGGPRPEVAPGRLDFGETALIAPFRRRVVLRNVGFDDLMIRAFDADAAGTGSFSAVLDDLVVAADGALEIEIAFNPAMIGAIESALRLEFDEVEPVVVPLTGVGVNLPPCTYTPDTEVDFGAVPIAEVRSAIAQLRNTGNNDCLIYRIAAAPTTDPAFEIIGTTTTSEVLPAGEVRTIEVRLREGTQVGAVTGGIELALSSTSRPRDEVTLNAWLLDAGLTIAPNVLDFGVQSSTCTAVEREVRVRNPLAAAVSVSSARIVSAGPRFSVVGFPGSTDLSANNVLRFDVEFTPGGVEGPSTGFVEIEATINGQPLTFRVPIRAVAADPTTASRRETFRQGFAAVDVLGVFNHTFRANSFNEVLRDSWPLFSEALFDNGVDYRIGVTTTDISIESGRFLPEMPVTSRVMTPVTMSPLVEWPQRFRSATGFGFEARAAFEATRRALSFSRLTTTNVDFRRPGAPLVVLLSHPEGDTSPGTVEGFIDALAGGFYPGQQNDWMVSALTVRPDEGPSCSGAFGLGLAANRVFEAVQASGGVFVDWCGTDRDAIIRDLGRATTGVRTSWRLAQAAAPGSLSIRVDGTDIPEVDNGAPRWSYDASSQAITFTQAATPQVGDEVQVDYRPVCSQ